MGFELPNGKTARNLQDQVKFLSEKVKELIARVNELELHIEIVDELPETGSSDIIYFVPVEDPEEGNYYNEYMWIDDTWELIGTTQIDLSDYMTLSTEQTISGKKTFSGDTYFTGNPHFSTTAYLSECYSYGSLYSVGTNDLGSSSYAWKDLYLSGKINFGNDSYITKDQYDRITLNVSDNAKIVVDAGQTYVNNNLLPLTATRDLGSSDYKWRDLYLSGNVLLGNSSELRIEANDSNRYLYMKHSANVFHIGAVGIATNLVLDSYLIKFIPQGNTQDLGSSSNKWRDIYLSGNLSDGTNTVSVAQIASGIGGTYRHVIYIEGAGQADITIAVNLNSATPIDTQAALAAINGNIMGGTATLDEQSRYRIVAIDSVATPGSIVYLDETGQHTLNIVDFYQDVVNQL